MTKAEILKREILSQYKSVRQFAIDMSIPYSTLVTALDRGIEGMAYGTVIKMCDRLNLNPVDFSTLEQGTDLTGSYGSKVAEDNTRTVLVVDTALVSGQERTCCDQGEELLLDFVFGVEFAVYERLGRRVEVGNVYAELKLRIAKASADGDSAYDVATIRN